MVGPDLFSNEEIDTHMDSVKKNDQNPQDNLIRDINDSAKRLKVLEDRYLTIRKKTQLTDQNMLEMGKRFNSEIIALNEELNKLRIVMKDMTEKINQLITETGGLAKRQELITLSKYVDLWRPMNFVTREQLDRELNHLRK